MVNIRRQYSPSFWGIVVISVIWSIGVVSCANKGYPEGGPKDETPPQIIKEDPPNYNTNFNRKNLNIYFDEFVQLKGIAEKFVISPPQAKKPRVRLRGKYIMVDFQDSLRKNFTYNLDFGDAIVDNNEGNPLGYYRYVFSTGDMIDSLELSGNIFDAYTNTPVYNVSVLLYENHTDSIPLKEIPNYVALTDSAGFFRLTNLRPAAYKVVALKDDSRDYKYTPEVERFAFLDSIITPVVFPVTRPDTLQNDSIVVNEYFAYGPNNLRLNMFLEDLTQLYMVDEVRKERDLLNFIFSIPAQNDFSIKLINITEPEEWYIMEQSIGKDTINLWITDSMIYRNDTLYFELNYLRTDTLGNRVPYTDTTRLTFREKKKPQGRNRKNEEEEKPVYEFLKINTSKDNTQDINKGIWMEFEKPIDTAGLSNIFLERKVDTLYEPEKFELIRDSLKTRRYYLKKEWIPGAEYKLTIDSASIWSIYGIHNNKFERTFKIKEVEDYGKLILHLSGVEGPSIVQLYASDGKKQRDENSTFKVVSQIMTDKNGDIVFEYVNPAKYSIRVIRDENRNGKWDTGLYLQGRQPEKVYYLPVELDIKKNFDVEQDMDLKSLE